MTLDLLVIHIAAALNEANGFKFTEDEFYNGAEDLYAVIADALGANLYNSRKLLQAAIEMLYQTGNDYIATELKRFITA